MRSRVALAGATLSGPSSRLILSSSPVLKISLMNGTRPRTFEAGVDDLRVSGHLVNLGRRPSIRVVEHLFSALHGMGFFSIRIDLHDRELPFFDGSSLEFCRALSRLREPMPALSLLPEAAGVRRGRSFLEYLPSPRDRLKVDLTLRHPCIGVQRFKLTVTPRSYLREIAAARTFVFTGEDDPRLRRLPPYGFALTRNGYRSSSPPRFSDEAVRHKILDLLGDLFVLGGKLCGTITGCNTSHELNHMLARKIAKNLKAKSQ